ncbi:MAG: hypothetical protein H6708_14580 [Kofleriaceae bacterium]|nr:hypothetical protein [Myxococcales bacterium]MCB9561629.1 hypothetical protein [Kofleriaceae bacterium]
MSGAIDAHTLLTHVAVLWAYAIVGSVTALVTAPVWSPGRGGGRGAALAGLLWPVAIPVTLTWLAVCALRRAATLAVVIAIACPAPTS